MVIILDRNAFKGAHILSVYFFIMSVCNIVLGMLSFFGVSFPAYIFGLLGAISGLYIFFPEMIEKAYLRKHIHHLLWHFSNCILALSWAIFFYLFWALFWGYMDDQLIVSCSLFLVLGLWLWVYNTDDKNPLFFS